MRDAGRTNAEIRAAIETFAKMSQLCRPESADYGAMVASAGVLHWLLGDEPYSKLVEDQLKEIRVFIKNAETQVMTSREKSSNMGS